MSNYVLEKLTYYSAMNGLPVDGIADPRMQVLFFSDNARRADGALLIPEKKVTEIARILIVSEDETQINQRFQDFFDEIGELSEEKIEIKLHYLQASGMPLRDLGFHSGEDDRAFAQGILLAHFRYGDSELLAFGTKDRNGQRRITLVEWPAIQELKILNRKSMFELITAGSHQIIDLSTENDVAAFLEWKTGSIILLSFLFTLDLDRISKDDIGLRAYFEMLLSREIINLDYISSLQFPKKSTLRKWEEKYYNRKAKTRLPEIRSVHEIQEYLGEALPLPIAAWLSVSGSKYALPEWLTENNQD